MSEQKKYPKKDTNRIDPRGGGNEKIRNTKRRLFMKKCAKFGILSLSGSYLLHNLSGISAKEAIDRFRLSFPAHYGKEPIKGSRSEWPGFDVCSCICIDNCENTCSCSTYCSDRECRCPPKDRAGHGALYRTVKFNHFFSYEAGNGRQSYAVSHNEQMTPKKKERDEKNDSNEGWL